eukprot:TRINITY_DN3452_c0_g1_i1.p1 TRINITY_DN3452_c0_g1~~TRINITY_DN3452_c0_g1_i1.p1  ORF type:complete len:542 (-),score=119.25 TRINITY_DN3452_c0_g1_i1:42-1667(-)
MFVHVRIWLFTVASSLLPHGGFGFLNGDDDTQVVRTESQTKPEAKLALNLDVGSGSKKSWAMILSVNMASEPLEGALLAKLMADFLNEVLKDGFVLPETGDVSKNWQAVRKALNEVGPDLIVIGCQECGGVNQQSPAQILACNGRLGDANCDSPNGGVQMMTEGEGAAGEASRPSTGGAAWWAEGVRDHGKGDLPGTYKVLSDYQKFSMTKPFAPEASQNPFNMMYQGVLARAGSYFDVDPMWDLEEVNTMGVVGNKGALITHVKVNGTLYTFANVHLDSSDPKIRKRQTKDVVEALGEPAKGSIQIVYGDFNTRLYAKDKNGEQITDQKGKPDGAFYYKKMMENGRGKAAQLLYKAVEDEDEFKQTWERNPLKAANFEVPSFTANVLPTYKLKAFGRDGGGQGVSKDLCSKLKEYLQSDPKNSSADKVDFEQCYSAVGAGSSLTRPCEGKDGKPSRCVDFGWIDRVVTRGPTSGAMYKSLGWWRDESAHPVEVLGDHAPMVFVAKLPRSSDASGNEGKDGKGKDGTGKDGKGKDSKDSKK